MQFPDLPDHTHATVLRIVPKSTLTEVAKVIVWADRSYTRCPDCTEPVTADPGCPVLLGKSHGETEHLDQTHGCGTWLEAEYRVLLAGDDTPTDGEILAAAQELADERRERLDRRTLARTHALFEELREALRQLDAPLKEGETREDREEAVQTGDDEMNPGIYRRDDGWVAWAFDPEDGMEMLVVTEREVREAA